MRELQAQGRFEDATAVLLLSDFSAAEPKAPLAGHATVTAAKPLNAYTLPAYYEMVKHPSDVQIWFKATEVMKKPGYKGVKVEWYARNRKPKKATASSIQGLDISQGYYKQMKGALPLEVLARLRDAWCPRGACLPSFAVNEGYGGYPQHST